ncbi:zinc finger protein-related [Raphanus sativus]|nr:zinc finger protein-related [Raphanus sativus]
MIKYKAAPEYANAKTAVWWDMNCCPVPEGYDAGRVRPSIEGALKELGYYGPVTITAMGDLTEAHPHFLQRLSSTGILVQHAITDWLPTLVFSDLMEFKRNNPPPATIMLISEILEGKLEFPLSRNQQIQSGYNLFLASSSGGSMVRLHVTADWRWKTLLEAAADSVSQDTTTTRSYVLRKCSSSTLSSFVCRACKFTGLSVASFTSHLSSEGHKKTDKEEKEKFSEPDFSPFITVKMNDQAAPEYVNSKTTVWWDMDTCPLPDGYDARRVRPSIEGALKDLGYYGPVTINCMGNLKNAHPHVLQGLSSTGILVQHNTRVGLYIYHDLRMSKYDNPPPATIMIISDEVEPVLSLFVSMDQQRSYYNLVLARTFTPPSMSRLCHTAEWLWQTLLARSPETTSCVLPNSASSFLCRSCDFTSLSVTDFTRHLSSEEHKKEASPLGVAAHDNLKPSTKINGCTSV